MNRERGEELTASGVLWTAPQNEPLTGRLCVRRAAITYDNFAHPHNCRSLPLFRAA